MNAVKFSVIIFLIGCLCNTGFSVAAVNTENPNKKTSVTKKSKNKKSATHFISKSKLNQIKAVFVVGPVEEMTKAYIQKAEKVAVYLRKLGANVYTFYTPHDKWEDIVKASNSAHIFYYTGHGTTCGENGKPGGLCLSNDVFIYSKTISQSLKLHKNALVIFNSACLSAGRSADDEKDIGVKEAFRRVSDYSQPFLKLGAGAYYANNYDDAIVPFLESFFSGVNMKNNYVKHLIYDSKLETINKNPYFNYYQVGISSWESDGTSTHLIWVENGVKKEKIIPPIKSYDIAFAGNPNLTYMDWFR